MLPPRQLAEGGLQHFPLVNMKTYSAFITGAVLLVMFIIVAAKFWPHFALAGRQIHVGVLLHPGTNYVEVRVPAGAYIIQTKQRTAPETEFAVEGEIQAGNLTKFQRTHLPHADGLAEAVTFSAGAGKAEVRIQLRKPEASPDVYLTIGPYQ
jgi:hypothetical protein